MANGKLVFFGTSDICLPFLEALTQEYELSLMVTQPDALGGRNRKKVIEPPVKIFARENGIPFEQPETLKDDAFKERLRESDPLLGVVISYGQLIPKSVFTIPKHRMINVHFSMLPLYRGAAPVQRGVENGDTATGISIFELVKKMDAGPVWAQKEYPIGPDDTTESLWKSLSTQGAEFLMETTAGILDGRLEKVPQDHDKATFAPPVRKDESLLNWEWTAQQVYNKYRAFTPWPGLCCEVEKLRFKLTNIRLSSLTHDQRPGDVLSWDKKALRVCCGEGTVLEILELQPPGKKPMTPHCFCQGNELPDRLC